MKRERLGLRAATGLSWRGLAKATGISVNALHLWDSGARCPHRSTMEAVADVLGVPAATLDGCCWQTRTRARYGADPAGLRLQALRRAAGMTATEVAAALGISRAAVDHWEAGHGCPPPGLRGSLARLYAVETVPLPAVVAAQMKGANLAAVRRRAGLTQRQAASATEVTPQTLGAWERGTQRPRSESLAALARLYGVPEDQLLGGLAPGRLRGPLIDGVRLSAARRERGWTQPELAARIGVSVNTIARWETQPRAPQPAMWAKLTKALGVSVADLAVAPGAGGDAADEEGEERPPAKASSA